jgi:hypothetical protein
MLVLSPEQLATIERHMYKSLQTRLQRVIAATFPELNDAGGVQEKAAERVGAIVQRGVETALNYGIEEPADLAAFIALGLAWRTLPSETSVDWITRWLERTDTSGATKLAIIEAQLASSTQSKALSVVVKRITDARREVRE